VSLNGEPLDGGYLRIEGECPLSQPDTTPDGQRCGCPRSSRLVDGQCTPCPAGYSTEVGELECARCAPGFYAAPGFENATFATDARCKACPEDRTSCPDFFSTVKEVQVKPNYWRLTAESEDVLECKDNWDVQDGKDTTPCVGGGPSSCIANHGGPRCRVCVEDGFHVGDDGICSACPDGTISLLIAFSIIVGTMIALYPVNILLHRPPPSLQKVSDRLNAFVRAVNSLGPSKMKSAVTFYQIILSLPGSFDLDPEIAAPDVANLFKAFKFIEFDWSEAVYPTGCLVGGYSQRLYITCLLPLASIVVIPMVLIAVVGVMVVIGNIGNGIRMARASASDSFSIRNSGASPEVGTPGNSFNATARGPKTREDAMDEVVRQITLFVPGQAERNSDRRQSTELRSSTLVELATNKSYRRKSVQIIRQSSSDTLNKFNKRLLALFPLALLVVFVMLPSVSRSIFAVWDCEPYESGPDTEVSYMKRDMSLVCESDDHSRTATLAIVFIMVWPIGMQMFFFMTLWLNRKDLRAGRVNSYTQSTRFLTGGYKPEYFFWETIELSRRLACSGFIILIPQQYISMRIAMAIVVSLPILVMTAILKPFKNPEDSWLALASQAILVFAYSCCALLRVLDAQWLTDDIKQKLIGFTNPTGVFTALAICFVLFLFFVLATYLYKINEEFSKQIRKMDEKDAGEISLWIVTGAGFGGMMALIAFGIAFGIVYGLAFGSVFFLVGGAVGGVAHAKIKGSPVKADVQVADIQEADVQEAKATEVQAAEPTVLEQSRIVDMTTSRC